MIESDGDLHGALVSFLEVARVGAGSDAAPYQSLHIEECVEVMMQRCKHSEPLEIQSSSKRSSTSADEQATQRSKHVWYQWMCVYLYIYMFMYCILCEYHGHGLFCEHTQ